MAYCDDHENIFKSVAIIFNSVATIFDIVPSIS